MLTASTYAHPNTSSFKNPMTRMKPHTLITHHHHSAPFIITENEKYLVAQVAREKLLHESSFKDHDLRRLVGHANLVDAYLAAHPSESLTEDIKGVDMEVRHVEMPVVRDDIEKQVYVNSCVVEVQAGVPGFGAGSNVDVRVEEVEVSEDND